MVDLEEIPFATDMEFSVQILVDFRLDAEVRARFAKEGVTHSLFEYLTESDQRELMPKMVDRLNFRKGLIEFKKLNDETIFPSEKCSDEKNEAIVIINLLFCLSKITRICLGSFKTS